jgi:hypothetical protein
MPMAREAGMAEMAMPRVEAKVIDEPDEDV